MAFKYINIFAAQGIGTDFKRKGKAGKHEQQRKKLAGAITKERASRLEKSFGKDKEHYHLKRIRARTKSTEILWIFFGIHTGNALEIGRRISVDRLGSSSLNLLFVNNLPGEGASYSQKNWSKNPPLHQKSWDGHYKP